MVSDEKIENRVYSTAARLHACLLFVFKLIPHDLEGSHGTYAQCRGL